MKAKILCKHCGKKFNLGSCYSELSEWEHWFCSYTCFGNSKDYKEVKEFVNSLSKEQIIFLNETSYEDLVYELVYRRSKELENE